MAEGPEESARPGMAYRLTRKAAADVRHIYTESIRQFGPAQAARYRARLRRTFDLLTDSPELAREERRAIAAGAGPSGAPKIASDEARRGTLLLGHHVDEGGHRPNVDARWDTSSGSIR